MLKWLFATLAIALCETLFTSQAVTEKDTSNSTPRIVSVAILQPVAELLSQAPMAYYRKDLRGPDSYDSSPLFLTEFASGGNLDETMTGGPIVLRYASKSCGFYLPAGRLFMASMAGPVVDEASMIFPMETMSWDEMQAMVRTIVSIFDSAGWTRTGRATVETITTEGFGTDPGPKWAYVGEWTECNNGPGRAHVSVRHYNSTSPGSFVPPAALSRPLDEDAEDRFLMYVSIMTSSDELDENISSLVDARRTAEGVDPLNSKLPASIWLDDPDWRPAGWNGGF